MRIIILGLLGCFGEVFHLIGIIDNAVFICCLKIMIIQLGGNSYCLHPFIMPFLCHSIQGIGHAKYNGLQ